MTSHALYLGLKGHVVALDRSTGAKLWQTKLKGGALSGDDFVSLLVHEGRIYAHTRGELFCVEASTGAILWRNDLPGLGYDLATLALEGASNTSAQLIAQHHKRQSDSANTAAATAAP